MNSRALIRYGYVVFAYLMLPLILLHLLYKSLGDSNYLKRINERFGFNGNPLNKKTIWIHAVSYGEVKAASLDFSDGQTQKFQSSSKQSFGQIFSIIVEN